MRNSTNQKPKVEVRHRSYQPKRGELRQAVKINTTPENLAKSTLRQVKVVDK